MGEARSGEKTGLKVPSSGVVIVVHDFFKIIPTNHCSFTAEQVAGSGLVAALTSAGDRRLMVRDETGTYHFNGTFRNADDVTRVLAALAQALNVGRARSPPSEKVTTRTAAPTIAPAAMTTAGQAAAEPEREITGPRRSVRATATTLPRYGRPRRPTSRTR